MTLKPRPSDSELLAKAQAQRSAKLADAFANDFPCTWGKTPIVPGPNAITSAITGTPAEAHALVKRLNPDGESADRPKKRDDPEHREQVRLFQWIDAEQDNEIIRQAYAVPNGGKRSIGVAKKLKAEGVRAGECDINLDVPRGHWHGLRIELKVGSGRTTPAQELRVAEHLTNGYYACVCIGWEAACDLLRDYMALGDFRAAR